MRWLPRPGRLDQRLGTASRGCCAGNRREDDGEFAYAGVLILEGMWYRAECAFSSTLAASVSSYSAPSDRRMEAARRGVTAAAYPFNPRFRHNGITALADRSGLGGLRCGHIACTERKSLLKSTQRGSDVLLAAWLVLCVVLMRGHVHDGARRGNRQRRNPIDSPICMPASARSDSSSRPTPSPLCLPARSGRLGAGHAGCCSSWGC